GGLFPEHEISGILLVILNGDAGAGKVVFEVAAGELAVIGHGFDVEKDFAGRIIGVAAPDEAIDQSLHFGNVVGGARLDGWIERAEGLGVGEKLGIGFFRHAADGLVERQIGEVAQGAGVYLVVDIGDVADIGDVIGAVDMAQQAK